jgi:hypothetical protein
MRTYHQDQHVHLTSVATWIDSRIYPLAELDRTWPRGGTVTGRRILIGVGVLLLAILIGAVTSYGWWMGGLRRQYQRWLTANMTTSALVAFGALAIAVLGAVAIEVALRAIEDIRGYGRHQELWASISGYPLMLLSTNDGARFGQVRRALVRALDDLPTGTPEFP